MGSRRSLQITVLTRIVMKTIILPSGNAFDVDSPAQRQRFARCRLPGSAEFSILADRQQVTIGNLGIEVTRSR